MTVVVAVDALRWISHPALLIVRCGGGDGLRGNGCLLSDIAAFNIC